MTSSSSPITVSEARALFAPFGGAPALLLAVSGGPDSTALLWLAARWRKARKTGPALIAATVDHRLRPEAAAEAGAVKALAAGLGIAHRTLIWRGDKPERGVPAAAREARYALLAAAGKRAGASHIVTAHTHDDQAETVLMRLLRGSGVAGLAAMAAQSERGGLMLARPFLSVPKARLVATVARAGIPYASDPTNENDDYLRPRLRRLFEALRGEGLDPVRLVRLAARAARADAALNRFTDAAVQYLSVQDRSPGEPGLDAGLFSALPEEVQLRLLLRGLGRIGHEGEPRLARAEALLAAIDAAMATPSPRLKQTLAGAVVTLAGGRLRIAPAPPRRARRPRASEADQTARSVK